MTKADLKKKNIHSINNKWTPLEIAQRIPWENIKHCIVLYVDPDDENAELVISDMPWSIRTFLATYLNARNHRDIYEDNDDE